MPMYPSTCSLIFSSRIFEEVLIAVFPLLAELMHFVCKNEPGLYNDE